MKWKLIFLSVLALAVAPMESAKAEFGTAAYSSPYLLGGNSLYQFAGVGSQLQNYYNTYGYTGNYNTPSYSSGYGSCGSIYYSSCGGYSNLGFGGYTYPGSFGSYGNGYGNSSWYNPNSSYTWGWGNSSVYSNTVYDYYYPYYYAQTPSYYAPQYQDNSVYVNYSPVNINIYGSSYPRVPGVGGCNNITIPCVDPPVDPPVNPPPGPGPVFQPRTDVTPTPLCASAFPAEFTVVHSKI